ncbi:hypothetical protein HOC80_00070 [archaeon]|jgi:hypothetical protein|nr:hypothetical protein [archaeon]MBT4416479.1 hypothetical protein [archaeon]
MAIAEGYNFGGGSQRPITHHRSSRVIPSVSGNSIFREDQALVVSQGDTSYEIDSSSRLSKLDASYIRKVLPFSEKGDYFQLAQDGSLVKIASVSHSGSTMDFELKDGREFSVDFQHIDLELVVRAGRKKRVNLEWKFPY